MALILNLTDDENSGIRGVKLGNGKTIYSVYDFIKRVCEYETMSSTKSVWQQLISSVSEHKQEVDGFTIYFKFKGQGQRETPCMTIRGLQKLLMILGGKVAQEYRKLVESTFTRVMAGDPTLHDVIDANAASSGPAQEACREALNNDAQESDRLLDDMAGVGKRDAKEIRAWTASKRQAIAAMEKELVVMGKRVAILGEENEKTKVKIDLGERELSIEKQKNDEILRGSEIQIRRVKNLIEAAKLEKELKAFRSGNNDVTNSPASASALVPDRVTLLQAAAKKAAQLNLNCDQQMLRNICASLSQKAPFAGNGAAEKVHEDGLMVHAYPVECFQGFTKLFVEAYVKKMRRGGGASSGNKQGLLSPGQGAISFYFKRRNSRF